MVKILFLLSFFFSLFFTSPFETEKVLAAGAYQTPHCYIDGQDIGTILITEENESLNWLVSNHQAEMWFMDLVQIVQNNEVSMKLGNSPWVTPTNLAPDYIAHFNIGWERCGYYWGTVRFRSKTDGQLHFCNVKVPKYDTGPLIQNFINQSCVTSICRNTSNPLARAVHAYGDVRFSPPSPMTCPNTHLYLNGDYTLGFSYSTDGTNECKWWQEIKFTSTNGVVEAYVSPQPAGGFTSAQADAQLYNYINETSCGSAVTSIPTIPPASKSICSKVTGYVKNSVTKLGVKGAKVTAHGIDNSVGNCQGKHYGCSTATTNSQGYFEVSCANVADANTKCIGVYETNKAGFTDAYGAYGPTGSRVWNNNTIMLNNPQTLSCGTFNFFDKK